MKLLNWMFASAVAFSFAACSNNDGVENGANGDNALEQGSTYAALSLNFDNRTTSRANTPGEYGTDGTDEENTVTTLRLIVVNAENKIEYNDTPSLASVTSPWKKQAFTIKLTPGQKKFYAVLNEDVAYAGKEGDDAASLTTYLTEAVKTGVTAVATDNKFMMTNVDEVSAYLQNNVTASEAQAGKNNVSILVDRVSAKVVVKAADKVTYNNNAHVTAGTIQFALGNADLTATAGYGDNYGFYRMQKHNEESTVWYTPYTDFEPAKDATHTAPASDAYAALNTAKYCLENVHTYGTDAASSKYKQGNTTYAAIRVPVIVNEKANLTYADGKLTAGTVVTVADATSVPFYYVNAAQAPYQALVGQYILSSDMVTLGASMKADAATDDAKKTAAVEGLEKLGIVVSKEYTDGYAYFKAWVNPETGNDYVSPVFRNNWYELTVKSIAFPGEPQKPAIDPDEPLKVENNAQITVNIRNWNLVKHDLDLD